MLGLAGALLVLIPLGIGLIMAAGVMLVGLSLAFTGFLLTKPTTKSISTAVWEGRCEIIRRG